MRLITIIAIVAVTAVAGCQTTEPDSPAVQLPGPAISTDLSDLVGVRASGGEIALRNRGYEFVRAEGLTTFHYNAAARDCARIVTADGRFQSIDKVGPRRCRGGGYATQLPGDGDATQLPGDAIVPGTRFDASGSIRCTLNGRSRNCEFGVVRRGRGDATVYITRPERLGRRIDFVSGRPVASNNGRVYGEWSGDTVIVTVGDAERYMVPDAVLFGG